MKKILSLFLACTLAFSLLACGQSPAQEPSASGKTENAAGLTEPDAEPLNQAAAEHDPVTVVDTDQVSLTVTGWESAPDDGLFILNATMTNKTKDTALLLLVESAFNGLHTGSTSYCEADPGETVNDSLYFTVNDVEHLDIGEITDILLLPTLVENSQYEYGTRLESVHYYPKGEENATVYQWQPKPEDLLIFQTETAAAYITGFHPDWSQLDIFGINLMLVNNSDQELSFYTQNFSVDDIHVKRSFGALVPPHASMATTFGWNEKERSSLDLPQSFQRISLDILAITLGQNSLPDSSGQIELVSAEDGTFVPSDGYTSPAESTPAAMPMGSGTVPAIEMEAVTMADNDQFRLVVQDVAMAGEETLNVNVFFENRNPDKSLVFCLTNVILDNVTTPTGMMVSVPGGASQQTALPMDVSILQKLDMGQVTAVELPFQVYDQASNDLLFSESLTLYPAGEAAAENYTFTESSDFSRISMLDNETGFVGIVNSGWQDGWLFYLYIENRSEIPLAFKGLAGVNDSFVDIGKNEVYLLPERGGLLTVHVPAAILAQFGITRPEDPAKLTLRIALITGSGDDLQVVDGAGLSLPINGYPG